jgi:hypothetical protein
LVQIEFFEKLFYEGRPLTVQIASSAAICRRIKTRLVAHDEADHDRLTGEF